MDLNSLIEDFKELQQHILLDIWRVKGFEWVLEDNLTYNFLVELFDNYSLVGMQRWQLMESGFSNPELCHQKIRELREEHSHISAVLQHHPTRSNDLLVLRPTAQRSWLTLVLASPRERSDLLVEHIGQRDARAAHFYKMGQLSACVPELMSALSLLESRHILEFTEIEKEEARLTTNLGNILNLQDERELAFLYFSKAKTLYESGSLQAYPEFDDQRALIEINLATINAHLNQSDEAISGYELAQELLESSSLRERSDLDEFRVKLAANHAKILIGQGKQDEAQSYCRRAMILLRGKSLRDNPGVDNERAKLAVLRGNLFINEGKMDEAADSHRMAYELYSGETLNDRRDLDPERASLAMNIGTIFASQGENAQAQNKYQLAYQIYESDSLKDRRDLDPLRARLAMNEGVILHIQGKLDAAHSNYQKAHAIYEDKIYLDRRDLDLDRARLAINHGNTQSSQGKHEEAQGSYKRAYKLCESARDCGDLDEIRVSLALSIGTLNLSQGNVDEAEVRYRQAYQLLENSSLRDRRDLDVARIRVAMNIGSTLHRKSIPIEALNWYECAKLLCESKNLRERLDLDEERALLAMKIGNTLSSHGLPEEAVSYFKHSSELLNGASLRERGELDSDRARAAVNLGLAHIWDNDPKAAVPEYHKALKLYEQAGTWLPLQFERALLYANCSEILQHWPDALSFAAKSSSVLQAMFELRPDPGVSGADALWNKGHSQYIRFHLLYLTHALSIKAFDVVPQIILALQGREVLTELIDAVNESEVRARFDDESATVLLRYRDLRSDLRKVLEEQQNSALMPIGTKDRQIIVAGIAPVVDLNKDRRTRYDTLLQELGQARKEAEALAGFETLAPDATAFDAERLAATLAPRHALAVLTSIGEDAKNTTHGVWLLSGNGVMTWEPMEGLGSLLSEIDGLTQRLSRGRAMRRCEIDEPVDEEVLTLLQMAGLQGDWQAHAQQMQKQFWEPLSENSKLAGVETLHVCTMGENHRLLLGLGQPEGLAIACYPGMVFYALASGLIERQTPLSVKGDQERAIGVVHYASEVGDRNYLPGVKHEVAQVAEHYAQSVEAVTLEAPEPFPNEPLHITRFHFCGHGSVDPKRPHSTAMLVGPDQWLSQQQIQLGQTRIQHAFHNACFTGYTQDDSRGTTQSVIVPMLQQGSYSVVASTMPIQDQLAVSMARSWYEAGAAYADEDGMADVKRLRSAQWAAIRRTRLREVLWQLMDKDIWRDEGQLLSSSKRMLQQLNVLPEEPETQTPAIRSLAKALIKAMQSVETESEPLDRLDALEKAMMQYPAIAQSDTLPLPLEILQASELAEIGSRRVYVGKI